MNCPYHKAKLEKAIFNKIEVDYCPVCLGMFFNENELRLAKDEKDQDLQWLDIDLWQDKTKLKISKANLLCPECQVLLYEVGYGDSKIKVDICTVCKGVWLDRGEFKNIIDYLKDKAQYEILENYFSVFLKEVSEIFIGPEPFKEEILDVLTILKLLNYKFAAHFPTITKIISGLPK